MSTNTITVNELSKITSGYATDLLLATRGTTGHKMNFGDFAKYVTETYQAAVAGQNQSIIDALNEVHTAIGGPQVAATAAAMTDQSKIYVYTGSETGYTAGNWYYYNGSAWTSGGVYNAVAVQTDPSLSEEGVAADAKATGDAIDAATVAIDDTLTQTGEAADAKKTGDEISELKNALTQIPEIKESEAAGVDLDVSDLAGNVILRIAGGHVQTKEFDSTDVNDDIANLKSGKIDIAQGVANAGKALVVGADGNVTPEDITIELDDTLTQQGEAADAKAVGDAIANIQINQLAEIKETDAVDVDLDLTDTNGNVIARFEDGHIKTKEFDSSNIETEPLVDSVHATSDDDFVLADAGGNVLMALKNGNIRTKRFNSININPNVVTVKKDGSGDFTNIRSALESITDADAINNPYIIEIYEGTYDVLDDYSQSEIEDNSFVGPMMTNGIYLKGIGNRNKVILYGTLDPNIYTETNRNNIATLNTQSECGMENLTVVGDKIRYAVHDDFPDSFRVLHGRNPLRTLINCVFIGVNTTGSHSYGAGTSYARDFLVENCAFPTEPIGIHMQSRMENSGQMIFTNCSGVGLNVGDYSDSSASPKHTLILNGCDFKRIYLYKVRNGSYNAQHMKMYGSGNYGAFCEVPFGFVYKTGDVETTTALLTLGNVVTADYGTATAQTAYGVCIGSLDGVSYVQRSGYILTELLGLTTSDGDYIGVSNGSVTVINTSTDSIGRVITFRNKTYIKLSI